MRTDSHLERVVAAAVPGPRVLARGLLAAAILLVASGAQVASGEAPQPSPIRSVDFSAQLDHCRALAGRDTPPRLLTRCFEHAAGILERGVASRRARGLDGTAFAARLEEGARTLAARLRDVPADAPARRERALAEIDASVAALRRDLSRLAAASHVELSLVSRGGVSLGSWQAGFLYLVTEWAKTRPGLAADATSHEAAFSTVTGASAGAVNGLAAAVEGCRPPNPDPRASLYFRTWVELGLFGRHGAPGLMPEAGSSGNPLALFGEPALADALRKTEEDLRTRPALPGCRVDFGLVATHLDRIESPIHVAEDGEAILSTDKLKEKFALRLTFGGADEPRAPTSRPVRIVNLAPPPRLAEERIYYAALGHEDDVALPALLRAVRASGAFPGAFPPVTLAYTRFLPGPGGTVLARRSADPFIDGGILDNTPVGLAVGLDAWRSEEADSRDALLGDVLPHPPRTYVFVEPEVRSWVLSEEAPGAARARERDIVKVFLGFTGDLLETSTDAQLSNTAEQYPFMRRDRDDWVSPRLTVPRRHLPITGARFYHFLAFLERDFRVFDFAVGMADAYVFLAREACLPTPDDPDCAAARPLHRIDAALRASDPTYACLRAYAETDAARVLAPIDAASLPAACSPPPPAACGETPWRPTEEAVEAYLASRSVLEPEIDACIEPTLEQHNFRALLVAMHNYKVWMQSSDYVEAQELERFFAELADAELAHRFVYVDLPTHQGRDEGHLDAHSARRAFRVLMQEGIDGLAADQEGLGRYALRLGGRAAVDAAYERAFPRRILGVGIVLNGAEAWFGQRLGTGPWRWDSSFRVFRIRQETFAIGLDPWTSELYLSSQLTRILPAGRFVDFEVGAGWALSETIAFDSAAPGHVAFRTGPRGFLALVFVQRIYVGVNVDYYPLIDIDSAYANTVNPVVTEWQWNLTGGWRFLF